MNKAVSISFLLYIVFSLSSYGIDLKKAELKLHSTFQRLNTTQDSNKKKSYNDTIREIFSDILRYKSSYRYTFDTLKTVGKIMAPDKTFRIINWNIIHPDGSYNYYGFIQYYLKTKDTIVLTELTDFSKEMTYPEQQITHADQWYGALYYEIISSKEKKRPHYLLLGWDGGTLFINRKIIDVISFSSSGVPKFGKNVLKFGKERKKRAIFEFSYMNTMKLFYDKEIHMIVIEHLTSINSNLKNNPSAYGSDLTFDGLKYNEGKWTLKENINVRNKKKQLNKRKKNISYTL